MPIYRAPVFEDAHGRAPGVQIGSAVSRALDLDRHVRAEDCGSFFRVHTLAAGLRPGWSLANVADLAVMVVKVAEVVVEAVEDAVEHHKEHRAAKKEAGVKALHTEPEDAEPKKRHGKKKA